MKNKPHQVLIQEIRSRTPLILRQKIGPLLARLYYIDRMHIHKNSKKPTVLSILKTLDTVIEKKLSMIRFGDGEISLIDGLDLGFQSKDEKLAKKLEEIIRSRHEGLLICIPGMWGNLDVFADYAHKFVMHHMYRYNHTWKALLNYDQTYGDTNVTRHYLAYKDKSSAGANFRKIFSIWDGEKVVLIEGNKSRVGVGNDMFNNALSLKRILCPPENAYGKYDEIKCEALKISKDRLILLSLGPTAKVLGYELFLLGYRVVDIGHIDMEYEMFLRGEKKQVKVPYKYFNEINERSPEDCDDERYLKEILTIIS